MWLRLANALWCKFPLAPALTVSAISLALASLFGLSLAHGEPGKAVTIASAAALSLGLNLGLSYWLIVRTKTRRVRASRAINANGDMLPTSELYHDLNYDELTDLPNRHLLIDRLQHRIDYAERKSQPLGLMFIDLNRFKVINDNLGHAIGDRLLAQVAQRLSKLVRRGDSVSRWGGDEFVIFLEYLRRAEDAARVAKKVIQAIQEPFEIDGHQLHVSASIGISTYPKDGNDANTLVKHADMSMYRAKDLGTGNYCFFQNDMQVSSLQRLELEARLRSAVAHEELFLMYQPKIDTGSGKVVGAEALLRWHSAELGAISPAEFIPLAEEIGLIGKLSLWVLEQACRQNRAWQKAGLEPIQMAVNLSAAHLVEPGLTDKILAILEQSRLEPRYLEIEITENTFIDTSQRIDQVLEQLKQQGIQIAIDDFGTGYSCLSYLRDLPVDTLKIDGSFIRNLGDSKGNDGIVQAIITMGHSLGLKIVAECVEDAAQVRHLQQKKCDILQGYFFSKPLLPDDFAQFLARVSEHTGPWQQTPALPGNS